VLRSGRLALLGLLVGATVGASACGSRCQEGQVCAIMGAGQLGFNGDGLPALQTWLASPTSVLTDPDGTVLVVDFSNMRVRELAPDDTVHTRVGVGIHAYSQLGADRLSTPLENPIDAAIGPDGLLYLLPLHEGRVIRVGQDGTIEAVAGSGEIDDGPHDVPALQATMGYSSGLAFAPDGSLYVSDTMFSRVRRVGPDGRVTCVLGLGRALDTGPGYGPEVGLASPERLTVDADNDRLLVAAAGNNRVLAMDLLSLQTTVLAGTGTPGFDGDGGPATQALLNQPVDVAVLPGGGVLVSDFGNDVIRLIQPDGTIRTVLGDPSAAEPSVVESPSRAQVRGPSGLHLTEQGDLLIAERSGHRVLRWRGAVDAL